MHKVITAGLAAATVVAASAATMALGSLDGGRQIVAPQTLHLVAPVKGAVTTPTSDLTAFRGNVTNSAGQGVGQLRGYCVTVRDETGAGECTTTIKLAQGQVTLIGPTANRSVHSVFHQAVAGGTGAFKNARGQATVTLQKNQNVRYDIQLLP